MIARNLRFSLRQERDFFERARVFRLPHVRVYFTSSPEKPLRFAISVKKGHGSATVRAQTRRRIATALNDCFTQRPTDFDRSYHVVFMPLGAPQEYRVYRQEIGQFLESRL